MTNMSGLKPQVPKGFISFLSFVPNQISPYQLEQREYITKADNILSNKPEMHNTRSLIPVFVNHLLQCKPSITYSLSSMYSYVS